MIARSALATACASKRVELICSATLGDPPGETTHWTGRALAAASGVSLRSVQRIWAAHGLQPHRCGASSQERAAALPRWLHLYNVHRPHIALSGQPPITRLAMNNLLGNDS